ncbi:NIPSNAP-domain-containing protein [Xylariomycetidae sp. FL0641]|nr:NIPSNAP-domain-containing protein [Xylariomycetidae sp. FL0641]
MFTRRIARVAGSTPRTLRAFTSTATTAQQQKRTPSITDITPADVDTFNTKQKEFREQLSKAKQEREASRFPPDPDADPRKAQEAGKGIGSLKPDAGQKAEASKQNESERSDGLLQRVIYGTKEGREMDAQLEASFSAVLARGKYVHSIVFHEVKPKKVDEYVELVGNWYPKMASMQENKVNLVGSWRTEVGDCDTFVHIWEYQRYQGYHQSLNTISRHPEFAEFDRKLRTLIKSKQTSIMQEFSFWPTTAPRQLGGVFELRSYTLHPGNLLEWETHWRRGLKARREVMEGVGAWFVQIGDLNTVHHLWQFANLEERKVRREESWKQEGWAETVHKTVPLIQTMKSRILIPMPWSPVA